MNIDALEVPCAYCGEFPEIIRPSYEDRERIVCKRCGHYFEEPELWITGGINSMAGMLMRRHIYFSFIKTPKWEHWNWDDEFSVTDDETSFGGPFDTFEEAVLDAWKKLKMEEK